MSGSLPMGKYRGGICPAVLPLCLSHSVYSSIFFLENTTVPNLHEVKENMTMGTTLVTNPNGGFLVRGKLLFAIYIKVYSKFYISNTKGGTELHIFCRKLGSKYMFTRPLRSMEKSGLDPPCFPARLQALGT